jgi:hypothetical protein
MTEKTPSEKIREREAREAAPYIAKAKAAGRAVSFIASDGCEVTCFPDGRTAFNIADWY